jgi:hypothetical protein
MSRLGAIGLLVLSLGVSGCVAVAAGAAGVGTVKYLSNGAERTYPADTTSAWIATLESLRDLGYPVDPASPYPNHGTLALGDASGQVRPAGEGRSVVRVRFGTFDNASNRERARRFLDAVGSRLTPPG